MLQAQDSFFFAPREKRAFALELLETVVPPEEKGKVFPLLEDLEPEQHLEALSKVFPQERTGRLARLRQIGTLSGLSVHPRAGVSR